MNEKQLTMLSITGSIISLIVIYIFVSFFTSGPVKIGEISKEHVGKVVNVTGIIKDMNMKDGNIFFTLSDETDEIKVVLWSDFLKGLEMRGVNIDSLRDGVTVSVVGEVDVHKGYLEIVPTRPSISIPG